MRNVSYIEVDKLKPFENHPYYVKDDDEMLNLTQSISENGILSPLIVRPIENNKYEKIKDIEIDKKIETDISRNTFINNTKQFIKDNFKSMILIFFSVFSFKNTISFSLNDSFITYTSNFLCLLLYASDFNITTKTFK